VHNDENDDNDNDNDNSMYVCSQFLPATYLYPTSKKTTVIAERDNKRRACIYSTVQYAFTVQYSILLLIEELKNIYFEKCEQQITSADDRQTDQRETRTKHTQHTNSDRLLLSWQQQRQQRRQQQQ
jgi:hypothetical protein